MKTWNVTSIPDYFELFSTFEARAAHNFGPPQGLTQEMINQVSDVCNVQMYYLYGVPQISKLGIGRFINEMRIAIQQRASNSSSIKFALYSAHDGLFLNSIF